VLVTEESESESGIVVAENVALETYFKYREQERFTINMRLLDGKIISTSWFSWRGSWRNWETYGYLAQ
jgi:hypothetical protein